MPTVYIIKSIEGYVYTGSTTDLEKRLFQHNNKLAGWTKRGNQWKLIHSEEFETISEARKKGLFIKVCQKKLTCIKDT
jgi:putative endonuclease